MHLQEPKKKVKRFLDTEAVMFLATAADDRTPHVAAVFFAVDDDMRITFVTHTESRKAMNITENPRVAFSIGEHPPMNIQGGGTAIPVEGEEERRRVFDAVAEKAAGRKDVWPPIFRMQGEYAVYSISPSWMRMLDLESAHINEATPPFIDILV